MLLLEDVLDGERVETLVHDERRVGRAPYEELAKRAPALRPKLVRMAFTPGEEPVAVGRAGAKARGRRPSHASNATRS